MTGTFSSNVTSMWARTSRSYASTVSPPPAVLANRMSTPKGRSVSLLAVRISSRNLAGGMYAEPITPRPPALDTAAARGP